MIDYHIHTIRCGHAIGNMSEYVESAVAQSLKQIGFADHFPLLTKQDPSLTMSMAELPEYISSVHRLQHEYPEIEIKLGIEADFIPGYEEETANILALHPFDYVIGSIHFIDGWGFDDSRHIDGYSTRDIYQVYKEYYQLVARAAESKLFDIIGHLDLIKKYNFKPEEDVNDLILDTLSSIKEAGICVEINTSGLRKPAAEIYPNRGIVETCYQKGIPLTLGSDAHDPNDVGKDFDQALALIKNIGYTQIATFNQRKRSYIEL